MKPITWAKKGRIVVPEDGPAWRRHMSGVPLENMRTLIEGFAHYRGKGSGNG